MLLHLHGRNKCVVIVLLVIAILTQTGCSVIKYEIETVIKYSRKDFTTEEEAKIVVLRTLEER